MPSPIPATAYSTAAASQPTAQNAVSAESKSGSPMFGKDGFTFGDFLDIINPLQHIPIVSTIYRAVTGDKIDPGARIIGGGVFGGPIGLVASMISGMVEDATGRDPGEHALAALGIDIGPNHNKEAPQTMLAAAPSGQPGSTAAADPLAAAQPQVMAAQAQVQPIQDKAQGLKIGVKMDEGRKTADSDAAKPDSRSDAPIELPADLFQALKQTAAAQQAEAKSAASNAATALPLPTGAPAPLPRAAGPMQTNTVPSNTLPASAMPNNAIQAADGRNWYPASPMGGGGSPTRGVGTQPVTQLNATSKFGSARSTPFPASPQAATAAAATTIQNTGSQQNDWANRATDAYQKYFEMQEQKNLRSGITRGGTPAF